MPKIPQYTSREQLRVPRGGLVNPGTGAMFKEVGEAGQAMQRLGEMLGDAKRTNQVSGYITKTMQALDEQKVLYDEDPNFANHLEQSKTFSNGVMTDLESQGYDNLAMAKLRPQVERMIDSFDLDVRQTTRKREIESFKDADTNLNTFVKNNYSHLGQEERKLLTETVAEHYLSRVEQGVYNAQEAQGIVTVLSQDVGLLTAYREAMGSPLVAQGKLERREYGIDEGRRLLLLKQVNAKLIAMDKAATVKTEREEAEAAALAKAEQKKNSAILLAGIIGAGLDITPYIQAAGEKGVLTPEDTKSVMNKLLEINNQHRVAVEKEDEKTKKFLNEERARLTGQLKGSIRHGDTDESGNLNVTRLSLMQMLVERTISGKDYDELDALLKKTEDSRQTAAEKAAQQDDPDTVLTFNARIGAGEDITQDLAKAKVDGLINSNAALQSFQRYNDQRQRAERLEGTFGQPGFSQWQRALTMGLATGQPGLFGVKPQDEENFIARVSRDYYTLVEEGTAPHDAHDKLMQRYSVEHEMRVQQFAGGRDLSPDTGVEDGVALLDGSTVMFGVDFLVETKTLEDNVSQAFNENRIPLSEAVENARRIRAAKMQWQQWMQDSARERRRNPSGGRK